METPNLPPLREVIDQYGIRAHKSLGQHFLLDLNLTRRIASAAGDLTNEHVIEVGAGPGGLTRALMESNAESIMAIERDKRCVMALQELSEASSGRLKVIQAYALTTDLAKIQPKPSRIVSNLPYNIGTELLIKWLKQADQYIGFTLMFQREVAERITANPGSKSYGRLSVISQWLTKSKLDFHIPSTAFVPKPKVMSSVVNMEVRKEPIYPANQQYLEMITRLAFGQRRKMLRRSLESIGGRELLAKAGIKETSRAEDLNILEYCKLANLVESDYD